MGIAENYRNKLEEVSAVCTECGRDPESVLLLSVSKTVGIEGVRSAMEAGASAFGENRPDQILEKHEAFPDASWHFIGNIQSRRIPDIVSCATLIHSLYQGRHAKKIDRAAAALGKVQDVFIEVNVSGEESKSGVAPEEAFDLVQLCTGLPHVRVRGLMTMAPAGDRSVASETFKGLHDLFDDIKGRLGQADAQFFTELSMGMSDDWREAIAQGSTIVRIGRAVFSENFVE